MMYYNYPIIGWFGPFFMILFWLVIIIGTIALINFLAKPTKENATKQAALDILRERYAKGEINKQEFEEKSRDIKNL